MLASLLIEHIQKQLVFKCISDSSLSQASLQMKSKLDRNNVQMGAQNKPKLYLKWTAKLYQKNTKAISKWRQKGFENGATIGPTLAKKCSSKRARHIHTPSF